MKYPKISIITITYNSEKTVRNTFESIRKEKYPNLEYIIIDGGSTDNTLKIVEEYSDIISKVISEPDEGISDAMNKGIKLATGELIGIIHSDDALMEGALKILIDNWDGNTDVYYGDVLVLNEKGEKTHILCSNKDLSGMQYGFQIVHPATFVTKNAYNNYGLFDKKYKCAMDYELFLRFYKNGAQFKYIHNKLAIYREGGTNMKYRRKTIDEVRDISVLYGANKHKANLIRTQKILKDRIRPLIKNMHLKNKRVEKI